MIWRRLGFGRGATLRKHGHAVVLGAGVGGLLAARALADCYERVTVTQIVHLERSDMITKQAR